MEATITKKIKIPMVPTFIRFEDTKIIDEGAPVEYFTDDQLYEIGRCWTEKLIKHAQNRRAKK